MIDLFLLDGLVVRVVSVVFFMLENNLIVDYLENWLFNFELVVFY